MKKNLWEIREVWEDLLFKAVNIFQIARYHIKGGAKYYGLNKNIELKDMFPNNEVYVVGNAPSINDHDLNLLKDKITIFVNRSFLHADYEYICPTFHIFIDTKLAKGDWPLSYIDLVHEKSPETKIFLNASWYNLPEFKKYKNKENVYWLMQNLMFMSGFKGEIDLCKIGHGGAVVEQGILASIYMGARKIHFIGVEGNGLCHNLLGTDSHFYGTMDEDKNKNFKDVYRDLAMMSNSLRRWHEINNYCIRKEVELINLTPKGLMTFCKRMKYQDAVKQ